jgi:hypothetical protein
LTSGVQIRAILLISFTCLAQDRPFTFGFTAGAPLTKGVNFGNDESRRYTLGILGEYRFTDHISVQVNPLYRRTGTSSFFRGSFITGPNTEILTGATRDRSHNLDLPVLGKYYFGAPTRSWRPFLGAGFSLNTAWREFEVNQLERNTATGETKSSVIRSSSRVRLDTGAVAAAGVDFRVPRVHIAPEFRYTFHGGYTEANRRRNQVDFLVSFRL